MSRRGRFALKFVVVAMFAVAVSSAHADTITFNNDSTGQKFNGFQSVDSPILVFSNTNGNFFVATFVTFQNTSNVMTVEGSGDGKIVMDFSIPITSLSFEFGHNVFQLPPQLNATGTAFLDIFRNGVLVGQLSLTTDNNVLVDQSLGFSTPVPFDRAIFSVIAHGPVNDFGVGEVLDNITFEPVPEPATLLLLGSGLAAVVGVLRRRTIPTGRN